MSVESHIWTDIKKIVRYNFGSVQVIELQVNCVWSYVANVIAICFIGNTLHSEAFKSVARVVMSRESVDIVCKDVSI